MVLMLFTCFRVNTEQGGGAWCPKQQISPDVYEWLQIDLENPHLITGVETQGRFNNGLVCRKLLQILVFRIEYLPATGRSSFLTSSIVCHYSA